jgi:hypothetical protein
MTSLVWINFLLAAAFLLAWVGIPLWLVFKRRETAHDHSQAHAYLAAKQELARAELARMARPQAARRHPTARHTLVSRHHARVRAALHAPVEPRSGSGARV